MGNADLFARFKVPLSGYVVNRVLPEALGGQDIPEYLRRRLTMQSTHLGEIRKIFGKQVLALVPELERDVTGLAMISKVADYLCG